MRDENNFIFSEKFLLNYADNLRLSRALEDNCTRSYSIRGQISYHRRAATRACTSGRSPTANCECQQGHESIGHFLLDCTRWRDQRGRMLREILPVIDKAQARRQQSVPITESLLLGAAMLT